MGIKLWCVVLFGLMAQDTQSSVELTKATVSTMTVVTIEGVELTSEIIDTDETDVGVIKTSGPAAVIAQQPNQWPPKVLLEYKPGHFVLQGPRGSTWQVTVSEVRDGVPVWGFHLVTIPGDDVPPPPAPSDWIILTESIKVDPAVKDRATAAKLATAYQDALDKSESMTREQLKTAVVWARYKVGETLKSPAPEWNGLLNRVSAYIENHQDGTIEDYRAAIAAVIEGLK